MIIGLDVGGTHTDVVLVGRKGPVREIKVPTDSSDLFNTVLTGLGKITEGIEKKDIDRLVLSTTITTNAIVQDKLPPVGMIVSGGPGIDPDHYRTGPHYHKVKGSIDHRGREIAPVDTGEIKSIARKLKAEGIRYLGIVGKFSTRNPTHETEIKNILKNSFDKVFMGHQISGNLNFPRRIATTFLNASVYPVHKSFFRAVQNSLKEKGLAIPIHILKADGGTMNFRSSIYFPGQSILSGPAASAMGTIAFAPENGDVIALDIGGTTTDLSILINQSPVLAPEGIAIGNHKTLIRSLHTYSFGIGGDSHVRVNEGKLLVGPERKGPAMAFGGPEPTPTDALVALGRMQEGDVSAAKSAMGEIAEKLGLSMEDASEKILKKASQIILDEISLMVDQVNSKPVYTVHEILKGYKITPQKILMLGGPAKHMAKYLEKMSDYQVSTVPGWKVANAIGAALARTTCSVTLFADTEQGFLAAPEEEFKERCDHRIRRDKMTEKAFELLKQKALKQGSDMEDLEPEVLEYMEFNMVRGFYTAGKNIRVKVQIKPGLTHGYTPASCKKEPTT